MVQSDTTTLPFVGILTAISLDDDDGERLGQVAADSITATVYWLYRETDFLPDHASKRPSDVVRSPADVDNLPRPRSSVAAAKLAKQAGDKEGLSRE